MSQEHPDTTGGEGIGRRVNAVVTRFRDRIPLVQLFPGLFWLFFFFGVSFSIIVVYSFVEPAPLDGPLTTATVTLQNYVEFLSDSFYMGVMWDSFVIGIKVTVVTLLIAYPVAYFLSFTRHPHKNILVLLVILPFWINIVIRTYAWRLILGRGGVINYVVVQVLGVRDQPMDLLFSQDAITLGLVHVFLPFMLLPIYTSLDSFDREQIEAAKNLGANKLQAFYQVTLPQSLPGVAAGVAIVFVLAFGSFVIPLLLGGPRNIMLANIIGEMFGRLQDWSLGSAMAVTMTVISLALIYLFNRVIGLGDLYSGGEGE